MQTVSTGLEAIVSFYDPYLLKSLRFLNFLTTSLAIIFHILFFKKLSFLRALVIKDTYALQIHDQIPDSRLTRPTSPTRECCNILSTLSRIPVMQSLKKLDHRIFVTEAQVHSPQQVTNLKWILDNNTVPFPIPSRPVVSHLRSRSSPSGKQSLIPRLLKEVG